MSSSFYEFFCPVKVIAGESALEHIPFELDMLGAKKPMIITDKGVRGVGLLDHLTKALKQSDVPCDLIFDDVPPDSSLQTVRAAAQFYRDNGCDAVIAIGGGSVIDTSKALNILASEGGDDLKVFSGAHNLKRPLKPFIMIPTTAGTGAEVTSVAVISDTEKGVKIPFTSYFLLPNAAVIDPRMTLTLPPHITAMTAMDAMTHATEAFTCLAKNPISDAYATAAIKKINENLLKVIENPSDSAARLELAQASTMAGIAFSNSMVGLVHSLGHSLGAVAHLPHGLCMSLFLPYVLEYNLDKRRELIGELLLPMAGAEVYAATAPGARAEATIEHLHQLRDTLFAKTKLPRTLKETGKVQESDLKLIAEKALDDGSILFNPKEASIDDLMAILKKAWD